MTTTVFVVLDRNGTLIDASAVLTRRPERIARLAAIDSARRRSEDVSWEPVAPFEVRQLDGVEAYADKSGETGVRWSAIETALAAQSGR